MKIACCQFNPIWGNVEGNMHRANQLLEKYDSNEIDILVLPEMAFTGYVFKSKKEIMPYLEDSETGPTVLWAKNQAVRLQCYVLVGYPQKKGNNNYNSQCFVNPKGKLISTYQKTFLYETDENWAIEGPGFASTPTAELGKVGFGICMDINPYKFQTDFYDHEFANYHLNHETDLILCSMAWLKSKDDDDVLSTIKYWALRLLPLYQRKKQTVFVACNRTGTERGSEFAGGSCVFDISFNNITIVDRLDRSDSVLIAEI